LFAYFGFVFAAPPDKSFQPTAHMIEHLRERPGTENCFSSFTKAAILAGRISENADCSSAFAADIRGKC
jgi:hypothetical protein